MFSTRSEAKSFHAGKLRTTLTERLSPINAAVLKHIHSLLESGKARGKIVVEGF
ncbi:hypothetical protein HNO88_002136 [Novosphingobium chloroacetimidivorans]|uniref:Uncharacterized protein n=1 Tax=Novosphingobium chloroacetimidivorans TaxID=1428314 RepID=A0A7W7KA51_9SPHN|nr:hypothetical protein [Novosphingobium chloroacetimidivorans]MBB4858810.1 hypothetical protein [Novosphingobium chloroacetimidivorans]